MLHNLVLTLLAITAPTPEKAASDPADVIAGVVLSNYVDAAALNRDSVREASGTGEPWRAAPGVFFAPAPPAKRPAPGSAFKLARLEGGWLWIRICSLEGTAAEEGIRRELDQAKDGNLVRGIILDLRGLEDYRNFAAGARLEALFMPQGSSLFSLEGKGRAESFSAEEPARFVLPPMAVIVNGGTAGVAEAMAESLRSLKRAIIFGAPTAGHLAEYGSAALPSGRVLRVPSRRVRVGESGPPFHEPVQPDIVVNSPEREDEMLRRQAEEGPAAFVAETKPRPRQNEAALVRGENPELEEAIRLRLEASNGKSDPSTSTNKGAASSEKTAEPTGNKETAAATAEKPIRDDVLLRALDFLRALDALGLNRVAGPDAATNAALQAADPKKAP